MNAFKLAKLKGKAMDILKRLNEDPGLQKKLETVLRENDFGDIADLALEAKKEFFK